ncbi:hypothetical protein GALMADRAFT_247416 [Galerina marginata CBS 339.88]|uniref:Uncharacterized protein n=1 Tax=Galerina marginata (strain CBS 339.88) TaxID=685588 RepID=A0A067T1H8_GALM3|nr:hypothetical protein GALMADRAFT_247416 [Galerina marginata CBS 339.88]
MYGGYRTRSPFTKNPFIPATGSPLGSRFPDISTPPMNPNQQQYSSWGDGSTMNGGGGGYPQQQQGMYQEQYPPQQQQQQFQTNMGYGQPQPQQMGMMGGMGSGYGSPPTQSYPSPTGQSTSFQPSSAFGQQLAAHLSGSSYGYLQGQQQPQSNPNAYNPAQQQLQNNPGYIAQFDPYSSLAQGWDGSASSNNNNNTGGGSVGTFGLGMAQNQPTGSTTSSSSFSTAGSRLSTGGSSYGVSASGDPHPRDYIRTHKAAIESWDSYAWKQLISSFEALMRAWETRKSELTKRAEELTAQLAYGGGYYVAQIQQEGARLQGLHKEADSNFGSVAASTFQMKEVFAGYRQSGDQASKARVREAMNASLQGLPGWPQPF